MVHIKYIVVAMTKETHTPPPPLQSKKFLLCFNIFSAHPSRQHQTLSLYFFLFSVLFKIILHLNIFIISVGICLKHTKKKPCKQFDDLFTVFQFTLKSANVLSQCIFTHYNNFIVMPWNEKSKHSLQKMRKCVHVGMEKNYYVDNIQYPSMLYIYAIRVARYVCI